MDCTSFAAHDVHLRCLLGGRATAHFEPKCACGRASMVGSLLLAASTFGGVSRSGGGHVDAQV
jgi:hypothetical protein